MTYEEAKRILHPDTKREALAEIGFKGKEKLQEAVDEACIMACEALDKQIPKAPNSGVGYRLRHTHELNPDCPIARYEEDGGTVGVYIYDTTEEAIEEWNRRIDNG